MRSRRRTRRAARLAMGFICLAGLLCLGPASGQPAARIARRKRRWSRRSSRPHRRSVLDQPHPRPQRQQRGQPVRKIRVTDVEVGRFLADAGHRMVGDYGSFQVFVVDEATAAALAGHDGVEVRGDYDMIMLNAGAHRHDVPRGGRSSGARRDIFGQAAASGPVRGARARGVAGLREEDGRPGHHVHPRQCLPRLRRRVQHRPAPVRGAGELVRAVGRDVPRCLQDPPAGSSGGQEGSAPGDRDGPLRHSDGG